jgi:hypothetical protein
MAMAMARTPLCHAEVAHRPIREKKKCTYAAIPYQKVQSEHKDETLETM